MQNVVVVLAQAYYSRRIWKCKPLSNPYDGLERHHIIQSPYPRVLLTVAPGGCGYAPLFSFARFPLLDYYLVSNDSFSLLGRRLLM